MSRQAAEEGSLAASEAAAALVERQEAAAATAVKGWQAEHQAAECAAEADSLAVVMATEAAEVAGWEVVEPVVVGMGAEGTAETETGAR